MSRDLEITTQHLCELSLRFGTREEKLQGKYIAYIKPDTMNNNGATQAVDINFEVDFWSRIIGDHMIFLGKTLHKNETGYHRRVSEIKQLADNLYNRVNVHFLDKDASYLAMMSRQLKLDIIRDILAGDISISLSATFINHMLNENEEMIRVLNGEPTSISHINKLWLSDAYGHAEQLGCMLDPIEKKLKKDLKKIVKKFKKHYLMNEEFIGFDRTILESARKDKHNEKIEEHIGEFIDLLEELMEKKVNKEVIATFSTLVPDHMIREENYYLAKLGFSFSDPTVVRTGEV